MAKNKTTETGVSVVDFINAFVDNEQKKADSFRLIDLMEEWSGFSPKMWGPTIIGLEAIITSMQVATRVMHP